MIQRGARRAYRVDNPRGGTVTVRLEQAAAPIIAACEDQETGPYFAVQLRADVPPDPQKGAPPGPTSDPAVFHR